jgi:hypothetical protein
MSKAKIESHIVEIENSSKNVFNYLTNFNNFKTLMPSQVTEWKATEDECSFNLAGMATIGMKIKEKTPYTSILITSHGKVPFEFELEVFLKETGERRCTGQLFCTAELNPMMKMMVEKPLMKFFNVLADKMKDIKGDY